MDLNREDIIWAAGLFEGEGCIDQHKLPSGRTYPRIKLKMTDQDVVERFASIFGMKIYSYPKDKSWKDHYKDAWYTMVTGTKAVAILYMLFPFLGERRKTKAEEVLASWKLNDSFPVLASNQYLKKTI